MFERSHNGHGRGIAAEDIPRIFEPFCRVGRQDVPEEGAPLSWRPSAHAVAGNGMGLAYVQLLVRRHGGKITCQSTLGVGTTFTIAPAQPERSS
jgi:signal transduction histidine kinase